MLKFSQGTTKAQMDEAIRKTFSLKEVIPGIVDIQQGYNFSKRSKGYELGITIRFEDRACLENYGPHPAHQEIFAFLKESGLEDLIVVDFEI